MTVYLTPADICTELVQFAMFRRDGLTAAESAALMGLCPSTSLAYENATRAVSALKSGTAPDATGAAPDHPKEIQP